jgi:O-antigen/teichoic acid export membrane protein
MKQTSKNILWNAAGNTLYNGLQWLITVIVTRRSGFEEAGILSLAMALSLTFRTVSYFGIHNFLVTDREDKYSENDYMNFRIFTCIISFVLCLIFALSAGYSDKIIISVMLYMVFRVSEGFSDLFYSFLQKNERLDLAGICLSVKAVITAAFFIGGFIVTNSLNAGLCLMSASSAAVLILFELPLTKHFACCDLAVKSTVSWRLALETLPVFVYTAETAVIFNAPKYFLSIMADEADVGVFSSVFSVALILQAIFQYMYTPFITSFAKLYKEGKEKEIKNAIIKILALFAGIAAVYWAFLQIFGSTIFSFVFGEYEHYGSMITPAVLSAAAYSVMTFVSVIILIQRRFSRLISAHIAGIVILAVSSVCLVPAIGINGASFGLMLSAFAVIIILSVNIKINKIKK